METTKRNLASDSFINSWPAWLRWILILPASILCSIIISTLYNIFISLSHWLTFGTSSTGPMTKLISSAILGGIFVYIGAFVAPYKQFIISIILLVLLSMVSSILFLFTFSSYSSIGPIEAGLNLGVMLIAGGYAVYSIHEANLN
jgi:hypothetical protein